MFATYVDTFTIPKPATPIAAFSLVLPLKTFPKIGFARYAALERTISSLLRTNTSAAPAKELVKEAKKAALALFCAKKYGRLEIIN